MLQAIALTTSLFLAQDITLKSLDGNSVRNQIATFGVAMERDKAVLGLKAVDSTGKPLDSQCDIKRSWEDGSIEHAVMSVKLTSGTEKQTISILPNEQNKPSPPSLESITRGRHFNIIVKFSTEQGIYAFNAFRTLSKVPDGVTRWLAGPLVNEWRIQGPPLSMLGIEHPNLNVIIDGRAIGTESAWIEVTVENVWHHFTTNVSYDVEILNYENAVLYRHVDVEHYFRSSWTTAFQVGRPIHIIYPSYKVQDLANTGLIPKYDHRVTVNNTTVVSLLNELSNSNTDILGNGPIAPYFPQAGGREEIGLNPKWGVVALLTGDANMFRMNSKCADLAQSFSIHMKEKSKGRIPFITEHPTITTNPVAAQYSRPGDRIQYGEASSPYTADIAHMPNLPYLAYLMTGNRRHLEEVIAWANYTLTSQNFTYREQNKGLVYQNQIRGQAWALRMLMCAARICPDRGVYNDTRVYFNTILQNNISWYRANALNQNNFGYWGAEAFRPNSYLSSDTYRVNTPWMHDMMTIVWNWMDQMGYHTEDICRSFVKWTMLRFTSGLVGFPPQDGAPFQLAVIGSRGPYPTMEEIWLNSFAGRQGGPGTGSNFTCAFCYVAIARAALAGGARLTVPKALEAFNWINNNSTLDFRSDPTWALIP